MHCLNYSQQSLYTRSVLDYHQQLPLVKRISGSQETIMRNRKVIKDGGTAINEQTALEIVVINEISQLLQNCLSVLLCVFTHTHRRTLKSFSEHMQQLHIRISIEIIWYSVTVYHVLCVHCTSKDIKEKQTSCVI